jgi:hypothetical protein
VPQRVPSVPGGVSPSVSPLQTIPECVLNLLANGQRQFDPNRHPGRYIHRPEDRGARNGLTWQEARDLTNERVVSNDWIGAGAAVALLEHERHAVVEFCLEVQAGWARCCDRLGLPDVKCA